MNRRLYFILPDVEISRKVEDDLLLARISEHEMHFPEAEDYGEDHTIPAFP